MVVHVLYTSVLKPKRQFWYWIPRSLRITRYWSILSGWIMWLSQWKKTLKVSKLSFIKTLSINQPTGHAHWNGEIKCLFLAVIPKNGKFRKFQTVDLDALETWLLITTRVPVQLILMRTFTSVSTTTRGTIESKGHWTGRLYSIVGLSSRRS